MRCFTALALLPLACASLNCFAQTTTPRLKDSNAHSWWVYYGEHPIRNSRWSLLAEAQIRRTNFASAWQQLLLRDGVLYNFSPNVQVGGGYAFVKTSRYGGFPAARAFKEHRIFGQVILKHSAAKITFEHRYRVEKRWLEAFSGTNQFWRTQNRFRYQLRGAIPFSKLDSKGRQWYFFAGDELFIGFGANYGTSHFDHNRAFGGIGYRVTRNNRLELSYLQQFLVQRSGLVEENNHTFRLQVTSFGETVWSEVASSVSKSIELLTSAFRKPPFFALNAIVRAYPNRTRSFSSPPQVTGNQTSLSKR